MTYLQLVNKVLVRLRESEVASVTTDDYSTMIGEFINDSKTYVENAFNWDALRTVISINTSSAVNNQVVTGSGRSHRNVMVNNTTSKTVLTNKPIQWILDQRDLGTNANSQPMYYAWNGTDGTDSKVELFPTPDGVYTLKFHMHTNQVALSADADVLLVPYEAVVAGAYARALVEE